MAQLAECPTLDHSSGLDLRGHEFEPRIGLLAGCGAYLKKKKIIQTKKTKETRNIMHDPHTDVLLGDTNQTRKSYPVTDCFLCGLRPLYTIFTEGKG